MEKSADLEKQVEQRVAALRVVDVVAHHADLGTVKALDGAVREAGVVAGPEADGAGGHGA